MADDGPKTELAAAEAGGRGAPEAGGDARFEIELRRGALALVAMHLLARPRYGYDLVRSLSARGFPIEEGTLYPLLRRLEQQGWVEASWTPGAARPRKYYVLTVEGIAARDRMRAAWQRVAEATEVVLDRPDVDPAEDA